MGQTPLYRGAILRITAAGSQSDRWELPSLRIAGDIRALAMAPAVGEAGRSGAAGALTSYGEVVEVSAIVGSGLRGRLSIWFWATPPVYGASLDCDSDGQNGGGVVRY